MNDARGNVWWQRFKPLLVVSSQRKVQRHDIFHALAMNRAVANGGAGDSKAVEEGLMTLIHSAFKKIPASRWKQGCQIGSRLLSTYARGLHDEMMLKPVPI